jgi:hypothetical protein
MGYSASRFPGRTPEVTRNTSFAEWMTTAVSLVSSCMWSFARCHDPTHLAGRPGPTSADPRLLDLWPGGRADAVPRERPAPARVATATDAPGPQLVRVLHGVPPGASANGWWHVLCGNCWDERRQARNRSKRQSSDVLIFWAVVGSFGSVSSASTDSLASNSSEQQLDSS